MTIDTVNSLTITLGQSRQKGTQWQVRVHKKMFGFKKLVSSDWFLDEVQAKKFAEQLAQDLRRNGVSTESLQQRLPGWTLHRPEH